MARRKWNELSPRSRRLIVAAATVEAGLKIVALVDLARRPAAEVRGPKLMWALAIIAVNSAGVVPIGYLGYGRRPV